MPPHSFPAQRFVCAGLSNDFSDYNVAYEWNPPTRTRIAAIKRIESVRMEQSGCKGDVSGEGAKVLSRSMGGNVRSSLEELGSSHETCYPSLFKYIKSSGINCVKLYIIYTPKYNECNTCFWIFKSFSSFN